MKKNNQLLDDFLRAKVEEAEFSYQEDYWVKMSAVLDNEEKKKRGFPFWRGLSMLLVLLAVGVGTYLLPKLKHSSKASTHQTSNSQSLVSDQGSIPASAKQDQANDTSSVDVNQSDNTPNTNNQTSNSSTQTNNQPNQLSSTNQMDRANTNTNPQPNPSISQQVGSNKPSSGVASNQVNSPATKPINSQADATTAASTSTSTQPHSSNSTSPATNVSNQTTTPSATSKTSKVVVTNVPSKTSKHDIGKMKKQGLKQQQKVASNNTQVQNDGPQNNGNDQQPASNQSTQQTSSSKSDDMQVVNTTSNTANRVKNQMHPIDTVVYPSKPTRDHTLSNPRYVGSLADYTPTRVDSITVITYQTDAQAKQIQSTKSSVEPVKPSFSKAMTLMFQAGVFANKGLSGNVANPVSWGFAPYLSVGFEKPLSAKLSMATHVGFTYFNGLNSELKINSYNYSFGADSSSVSILSKRMLQLYLPVSVYYEVMKNHFLMASIGAMYALDVNSEVKQTSMSNNTGTPSNNSKMATTTVTQENGYRSGFNQFDLFAQVGYSYKIVPSLMVQIAFQQGFFDLTKNSYFNNTINNTQTRLSLGVKYNFKRN